LLHEHPEFNLENYHLVTVGAGAAAKAVIYALLTKWMPMSLTIVSRSHDAAEELAEFCIAEAPGPTMRVLGFNDFLHTFEEQHYRLVLQATPVGSILHPGNLATGFPWHESDFAVDLVYNPHKTPFLRSAKEAGAKTLDGLGMLIVQAAFSQVYWLTGILPEKSPITDAEYLALRESLSKLLK
jgi:shikimate dehydrogenase